VKRAEKAKLLTEITEFKAKTAKMVVEPRQIRRVFHTGRRIAQSLAGVKKPPFGG
jgi:hypothetical protein